MKKTAQVLLPLLAVLALGACSHTYRFTPDPNVSAMREHKLAGRSIALDLTSVPDTYAASANGHNFQLVGIRSSTDRVLRRAFANEKVTDDPAAADYVLKLNLHLTLSGAIAGTQCDALARWDILQRGKVAASASATDKSAYPVIANAGRNCELASLRAVTRALDQAMSGI